MEELIESKRRQPGEDIASDLVAVRDEDGSRLSGRSWPIRSSRSLARALRRRSTSSDNAITRCSPTLISGLVTSGKASWEDVSRRRCA